MAQRNQVIRISERERERLDEAAKELVGTTEVPNGAVVSALLANQLEN